MNVTRLVIGAVLSLSAVAAAAQDKQQQAQKIQCFSISDPKVCESINTFPHFVAKFAKVFSADYAIFVNGQGLTMKEPMGQSYLYGVIEIVRVANPDRHKTGEGIKWSPVYALPFIRWDHKTATKWSTKKEMTEGLAMAALTELEPKLEKGELTP